jgi:hypothetical protein
MLKLSEIRKLATDRTIRQFGGLFLLFALVIAGLQWQRGANTYWPVGWGTVGLITCVIAQANPKLVRPLFVGWMILLIPINWVVSHLILGFLFFFLFTPIGLCRRALGGDPLLLNKPQKNSYWQPRPQVTDKRRYLRQY